MHNQNSKEVTEQGTPHKESKDETECDIDELIEQFKSKIETQEYADIFTDPDVLEHHILSQKLYDFIKKL